MDPTAQDALTGAIALPALSIPAAGAILLVLLPLAALLGWALGKVQLDRATRAGREVDVAAGETSLGGLMALLGLILAFSFGNALSSFNERGAALLAEANALGTAFLRADMLPEAEGRALQEALLDYARTRIVPGGGAGSRADLAAYLDTTLTAQSRLWPLTLAATADPVPAPVGTFVAGAMNEVIDAHLVRMQSFSSPLLPVTRTIVLTVALVALFMLGNRSGIRGRSLTWRTFLFSATLWVVMMVIQDTQRSEQGFVRTDQAPMLGTVADMERALAG